MFNLKTFFLIYNLLVVSLFSQQVETLTEPFNGSGGIAVDAAGILYVSNFGSGFGSTDGNNLFKVYHDGTVEEFATGLNGGAGNVVDPDGNIFQANINNNTISKITPEGNVTVFASTNLYAPVGVSIDSDGNIYAANCGVDQTGLNSITKITPGGTTSKFASSPLMNCPNGLTIDENDILYTCNYNNGNVLKIDTDGSVSVIATLPGGNNSHLAYANNNLYVAKRCDNKIYRVGLDGSFELIAGTGERGNNDGDPLNATINLPNGLAVSPTGDTLYFASKTSFNGECFTTPLNPVVIRMITGLQNITNIESEKEVLPSFNLEQNYPNPFNPTTNIKYTIPGGVEGLVTLKVYNILGREMALLVNEPKSSGYYEVEFNAGGLPSGIYIYVLSFGGMRSAKKLTLLK